jgi:hypothetical protein
MKVELNNKETNPFSGLRNCLKIFNNGGQGITLSQDDLNKAWEEVKDSKEKKEMFFSLLFSLGDITARQHNIFRGQKVDSGGNSQREIFFNCMEWMKKNIPDQFFKFMKSHLFNEYTCFDNLFRNRVQTQGKKIISIKSVLNTSDNRYFNELLDYTESIIKGKNPYDKMLVAKFLTLPRLSPRKEHKQMLPQTKELMKAKAKFLEELSKRMNWSYKIEGNILNFKGYREWRKEYNSTLESVLFSTGKIKDFDEIQFLEWLDRIPAQARFRVRNRIMFEKEGVFKYPKLKEWYEKWEKYKEEKQAEQRVLEEKVRQGQASVEDKVKLEKVKKEAKVTVGSTNFQELYKEILSGRIDKLKLESFVNNKVSLQYNSLVIIDDSGSMGGAPFNFAKFIASVCLVKNPDDDGRNLLGFFNYDSRLYGSMDRAGSKTPNSLMRSSVKNIVKKPFVDPHKSFYENYQNISSFCQGVFQGGGTRINSIPKGFAEQANNNPVLLDELMQYPVWTIVSDGEWNNMYSPEASMNEFFRDCENLLGFRPFIIAIDIQNPNWAHQIFKADRFTGIDNMIYIPSNPAQIEQILTNFKDIEIFDVYTPLLSLYRSNRYDLVRANVI